MFERYVNFVLLFIYKVLRITRKLDFVYMLCRTCRVEGLIWVYFLYVGWEVVAGNLCLLPTASEGWEGNVFSLFTPGWQVPSLAGGYLPWPGGYLPWQGVPTLARGVPTLAGGYLPWPGGTYLGWGVPRLREG